MSRQTRSIPLVATSAGLVYRCPFLNVDPGQIVEVRTSIANNVAGMRVYPQSWAPVAGQGGILLGPTSTPLSLDLGTTEDIWISSANAGDAVTVTVRDRGPDAVGSSDAAPPNTDPARPSGGPPPA